MKLRLSPSMMCANFADLKHEVSTLNQAGIDYFHMDIMDGQFVPNFGMGLQDYAYISQVAQKPLDVHLMIEHPRRYVKLFSDLGAQVIYFHPEAETQAARTIDDIHALGKQAGIAINPGTAVATIEALLPIVDNVMVMTVNPGFAGQPFLDYVLPKIESLAAKQVEFGYTISVDGAISRPRIQQLHALGVENFILGTSTLFNKPQTYQQIIHEVRQENTVTI
ncbi:ribulose phosphate epimerase [Lactobacillus sp. CBA3606]|uniref:ribulose-phosphate 3-epimerase n=1 Tax=Lactobacillus sp. CBA3606 TaxID=2099789 RepID=UPI000CFC17CC|nr:ribulose-phosphate 3-epimerase [Lactobacillus sp. CBA3606]AVK64003.1 ribulose phosphate epimerase [Lactobacillus sp. CBA3606]